MGVSTAMRVVSWNVNGLRAVLKNRETSLRQFLDSFSADIICLQEVKGTSECQSGVGGLVTGAVVFLYSGAQLGHDVAICEGYSAFFSFCRVKQGYSGALPLSFELTASPLFFTRCGDLLQHLVHSSSS